jgi:hypothetical protein
MSPQHAWHVLWPALATAVLAASGVKGLPDLLNIHHQLTQYDII